MKYMLTAKQIEEMMRKATKGELLFRKGVTRLLNSRWMDEKPALNPSPIGNPEDDARFIAALPDIARTALDALQRVEELENRLKGIYPMYQTNPSGDYHPECLWRGMPETFPGSGIKVAGLACPCPNCSVRC